MERKNTAGTGLMLFALWLVPAAAQMMKLAGPGGLAALALAALGGIGFLLWLVQKRPDWPGTAGFAVLALALAAVFLVVFPLANSHAPGLGSDRDDALNTGVAALLDGRWPYGERTYLGNPLTPLPGALLIALPFHLIGNAAFQNLLWAALFIGWCRRRIVPGGAAWLAAALVTLGSPGALQDFAVGGDYLANALYVTMAADLALRVQTGGRWARLAGGMVLAIAVSSRPVYAVVPVVLAGTIFRSHGAARSGLFVAVTGVVLLALNLPFALADPGNFPLGIALSKLGSGQSADVLRIVLPGLALLIAGAAFVLPPDAPGPLALIAAALAVMFYGPVAQQVLAGLAFSDWIRTVAYALPVSVMGTVVVLARRRERMQRDGLV